MEVAQIDGNEFFIKVFCEKKRGGFVSLMEALNALGLEVTNANVISCRGLVSNVFKVGVSKLFISQTFAYFLQIQTIKRTSKSIKTTISQNYHIRFVLQ